MKVEIVSDKGEYKEFPYKKSVYINDRCVWSDDFMEDISDRQVIEEFHKGLLENVCDYEEIYK